MQKVRTAIMIALLFVIENAFSEVIAIGTAVPDLMLGFVCVYAFLRHGFKSVFIVTLIVSILSASAVGRVFPIAFLMCGFGGLISYSAYSVMRFVPEWLRICVLVTTFSLVSGILEVLVAYRVITMNVFLMTILMRTIYTCVVSAVLYLIMIKTSFKNEDKGILLISERDFGDV